MDSERSGDTDKRLAFYLQLLSDPAPDRRWKAAEALGRMGDERAVDALIRALEDEDWRVRQKAAWALGFIGDPRALRPLRRLMSDPSDGVQDMARQASDELKRRMYRQEDPDP